jgi:hypothetical protein
MADEPEDFDIEDAVDKVLKCLETEKAQKWLTEKLTAHSSAKSSTPSSPAESPKSQLRQTLEDLRDFGLIPPSPLKKPTEGGSTDPTEPPTGDPENPVVKLPTPGLVKPKKKTWL